MASTARALPHPHSGFDADLVIVGGGITGMVALALARREGKSVVLLEAGPELGGNAQAGKTALGVRYPRGSTLLGTYSEEQRAFLAALGIRLPERCLVPADRIRVGPEWIEIGREAPLGAPSALPGRIAALTAEWRARLEDGDGCLPATVRDVPEDALAWDDRSFADVLRELDPEIAAPLATIIRSDAAQSAHAISALAAIVDLLICLEGQSYVLPGGNHAIVRQLARRWLEGTTNRDATAARTSCRVTFVRESEEGVEVHCAEDGRAEVLRARQLLLAVPSNVVASLRGVPLEDDVRATLAGLPRGAYHLANLFLDAAPLAPNAFYLSPDTEWVTDVAQLATSGQRGDPHSIWTAYVPRTPSESSEGPTESVADLVRRDLQRMFADEPDLAPRLDRAKCEITTYPAAMSAPAPGHIRALAKVPLQLGPRVFYAHSDLAFFSAMGAVEIARATFEIMRASWSREAVTS